MIGGKGLASQRVCKVGSFSVRAAGGVPEPSVEGGLLSTSFFQHSPRRGLESGDYYDLLTGVIRQFGHAGGCPLLEVKS